MAHFVRRGDYLTSEDFARALHEAGGPLPNQKWLGAGGYYMQLTNAIWGGTNKDFENELDDEQERNPHIFVKKWGQP